MANHLTPTELARESGLERREVLAKCLELGVPIFQGRIDKSLFKASLGDASADGGSGAGTMPATLQDDVSAAAGPSPGIAASAA
jgi:hypothetical protein